QNPKTPKPQNPMTTARLKIRSVITKFRRIGRIRRDNSIYWHIQYYRSITLIRIPSDYCDLLAHPRAEIALVLRLSLYQELAVSNLVSLHNEQPELIVLKRELALANFAGPSQRLSRHRMEQGPSATLRTRERSLCKSTLQ
ncbi:MAG: hypothetical protein P4M11_11940, partial [Candidatus Pacebacteria bacterium]|nr:hypothetical protein [Candidatus Paceibacterota bacterium]